MSESRSVDLSHLQCPYTLIQLSQAIRDLGENANLRIKIRRSRNGVMGLAYHVRFRQIGQATCLPLPRAESEELFACKRSDLPRQG